MALFEDNLVFVKIMTDKMEGGDKLLEELQKGRQGGLPWMVILDGSGNEIISSNDKDGNNCGCPVADHEIAHFGEMIQKSTNCDAEHLEKVIGSLKEYAATLK